jgi:hypothetical protein
MKIYSRINFMSFIWNLPKKNIMFNKKLIKNFFLSLMLMLISLDEQAMTKKTKWKSADWSVGVERAIVRYGLRVEPELQRLFKANKVAYPPKEVSLLAFKRERRLELWARDSFGKNDWKHIKNYPLKAYSGHLGPKLKMGDRQIPEGIYRLVSFNPYSSMHLSLQINYPNNFDLQHAKLDGRHRLGGDIYLHGKSLSVGCLAVGNYAIDQLFLLARRVGLGNIKLIIAPNDLRYDRPATDFRVQPPWVHELYHNIALALNEFPKH